MLVRLQGDRNRIPEGLFFPDTYLFGKGSSDLAVLRRAYRAMTRHLKEEWETRDATAPYKTPYEALTMASIIEKETGQAGERDLIGGVLVNRLRIGMRLQVDPTIIYGLGATFDGNLKRSHLTEDGPYNTYTRAGLPPTPIAMPGLASLRSAMRPGKDRRHVLRVAGRRLEPVLAHAGRAQPRGDQVPVARRAMRGRFLTLEGVDGAGKSTHLQFIADFVAARGRHAIVDARARRHRPRRAPARGHPDPGDGARGRDAADLRRRAPTTSRASSARRSRPEAG